MRKKLWSMFGTLLIFVSKGSVSIMSGPWSYQPPVPTELMKEN